MTGEITAVPANRLLASLPVAEVAQLSSIIKMVTLPQGSVLNEPGEEIENVYFPHSGMVALLAVTSDGRVMETATIGFDGAVGAVAGLGLHRMPTRAVVQAPLLASQISAVSFRRSALASSVLRELIVQYTALLLAQVQVTTACNALHPVKERLARWILRARDSMQTDRIPLTQEMLSETLGVSRSSVSDSALGLQATGLIHYNRGIIQIVNQRGLEAVACECYGTLRAQLAWPR